MEFDLLFSTYDVNDDGYLSWKEFCQLCYEVFPKMKPEEIRSAFVQLDANHVFDDKTGLLSKAEFAMWKKLAV